MEDRYYDGSSDDTSGEDLEEESTLDVQTHKKSLSVSTLLLAAIAAALVVIVMVTVWFWERPQGPPTAKRLKLLEHRIEQLEQRIARLNGVNERVMTLEGQGQKFMNAVDRLDRFETSISLRMDVLAKELSGLQPAATVTSPPVKEQALQSPVKKPSATPPPSEPQVAEGQIFHTVSAGETLYSISRRYGMSVDELRRANELDEKATIYPGQQLKVR